MLLSYLKLSLRLLARNPFFTFINVAGLAIGFACSFALWQYASSELHTDRYHPGYDRIVRIGLNWQWTDDFKTWGHMKVSWFDLKTARQINNDFPEIESFVRIVHQPDFMNEMMGHGNQIVLSSEKQDDDRIFKETKGIYADPNLFEFFSIPLLYGDKSNVIKDPHSIALSQTMSQKYFGNMNPVGELLVLNGLQTLKVTGVFKDLPNNTHLNFNYVLSNGAILNRWNDYDWPNSQYYLRLAKGTNLTQFARKVLNKKDFYWREFLASMPYIKAEWWIQPLDDIAFSNNYTGDYFTPKSKSLLTVFSVVAYLILFMAWVNYINLTLARTSKRLKEIATRKISGALAFDFVKQFLVESILINFIALSLAFAVLQLLRVPAQQFLDLPLGNMSSLTPTDIGFFAGVVMIGISVTGLYPAFMALKYNSKKLLSFRSATRSSKLTGILTAAQYAVAIVLLLSITIMYLQLNFIFSKAFGSDQGLIGIIESPVLRSKDSERPMTYFKDHLMSKGFTRETSLSNTMVGDDNNQGFNTRKNPKSATVGLESNGGVSEDFIPFFGITLLAGRNFVRDDRADVVILSRTAIHRFGYEQPQDAIGTTIWIRPDNLDSVDRKEVEVIGVIEDYGTKPLFNLGEVSTEYRGGGICLTYRNGLFGSITSARLAVKIDPGKVFQTTSEIEQLFAQIFPGNPFIFYFLNDNINRHYKSELASRNQILFFSLLAIGVSCLGLLGMISNKVVEKTKEIGIRKILGAKLYQIARILLKTTSKHIAVATFVAIPIAYYFAKQYLEKFSERIVLRWWHFTLPVLILVAIMLATIASVLWKAARSNPVEALKYE